MILCGTGHRPEDIKETKDEVCAKIRAALLELSPATVISGCAAGYDLWLGCEAIDMGIETWAAKPWAGHTPRRGDESEYARLIAGAKKVIYANVSSTYLGPFMYHDRNHWMVDNADEVLAYWCGKTSGGTYACLQYAQKMNKPVRNIYKETEGVLS